MGGAPGMMGAPPPNPYGGPPPQAGYGAPPPGAVADYGNPGAMQPYGGGGGMMMQGAPPGGGAMVGGHGPKGMVRNGTMVLVYSLVSCGIYQMIWFFSIAGEMKAYLQRDEPDAIKIFGLSIVTCGLYSLYWMLTRCGALIQEMQQRAGVPNPQNPGIMLLIPYYNVILLQDELNKVWQSPG
jgi:hypothetical protein